jgi:hypothetical protein
MGDAPRRLHGVCVHGNAVRRAEIRHRPDVLENASLAIRHLECHEIAAKRPVAQQHVIGNGAGVDDAVRVGPDFHDATA